MQNKWLFFFSTVFFLCLVSCTSLSGKETIEPVCSSYKAEFNFLDSALNLSDKLSVIRFGSVEMVYDYSVLTINPNDLNSNNIKVAYSIVSFPYSLNDTENFNKNVRRPTIMTFNFWLSSQKLTISNLMNSVDNYNHCNFSNYIDAFVKRGSVEQFGDGFGGNKYVLFLGKGKEFGVVDKYSDPLAKDFVKTLFRQISINEYVQTYSLEDDWRAFSDSVAYMFDNFTSVSEALDMQIRHDW